MKGFTTFFQEANDASDTQPKKVSDDIVQVFGRYNPPHLGHGRVLDHAHKLAGSIGDTSQADQSFYASKTQDNKKNPLPHQVKTHFLKKMFPQHAEKWDEDDNVKTILGAATKAHDQGYKNYHFVGGDDRKQGMEDLLRKYNGQLYNFDNIYSHSAGERNEDSEDPIAKLSASGQRRSAMGGDFAKFREGIQTNKNFTMQDARRMFEMIQTIMQKNEEWEVDTKNTEFIREMYKTGQLFTEGDEVESLSSGLRGKIHRCGTNHLICISDNNIMFKSFVEDVVFI